MKQKFRWIFILLSLIIIFAPSRISAASDLYPGEGNFSISFDFGQGPNNLYPDSSLGLFDISFLLRIAKSILFFFVIISASVLMLIWFQHFTWGDNDDVTNSGIKQAVGNVYMLVFSLIGFFVLQYILSNTANAGL